MVNKKLFYTVMLLCLFLNFIHAIEFSIEKISVNGNDVSYEIVVENPSESGIILTDINGKYFTYRDGILFIELYAHDEIWEHPQMAENYQTSKDFFVLSGKKSVKIKRKLKIDGYYKNNYVKSSKSVTNLNVSNVVFLIGYERKVSDEYFLHSREIPYPALFKNQSIKNVYNRDLVENFDLNQMETFLFEKMANYGREIEKKCFLTLFCEKNKKRIPELINRVVVENDFVDCMGHRIFILDMAADLLEIYNSISNDEASDKDKKLISDSESRLFQKLYLAAESGIITLEDFVSMNSKFGTALQDYCTKYNDVITVADQSEIDSLPIELREEYSFFKFVSKFIKLK